MQIASVSRPSAPSPERDPSRQTLVAGLLLSLTTPAVPFRSEPAEFTQRLRAQRRDAIDRRQQAMQARDASVTRQLRDSERRMRPGSHSFRQALRREQRLERAAPQAQAAPTGQGEPSGQPAADRSASTPPQAYDGKDSTPPRSNAPAARNGAALTPRSTGRAAGTPSSEAPAPSDRSPATAAQTGSPVGPSRLNPAAAGSTPLVTRVFAPGAGQRAAPVPARPAAPAPAAPSDAVSPAAGTDRRRSVATRRLPGAREPADPAEARAQRARRIERIVRVVRHTLQRGQTRATLRLDPPHIGKLRIDMELRSSTVYLRFEPTHELAHRLLREQSVELAAALRAVGLDLQRIEIAPPPDRPPPDGQAHGGMEREGGGSGGDPHSGRRARKATAMTTDFGRATPEIRDAPALAGHPRFAHGVNVWA